MLTYPGFNKVAFELGPIKLHWYGIMYLLGFAAAWWLARRRAAQPGSTWKKNDVDDVIFFAMLGVILGGRIGYVLFYGLTFWANDAWYPLRLWEGGMSFHGGMLGVAAALTLFAWRRGRHPADVYDFTVPLPALGLFFGRDRKSTRLNSSHSQISYAVFCLKKKKKQETATLLRPALTTTFSPCVFERRPAHMNVRRYTCNIQAGTAVIAASPSTVLSLRSPP